MNLEENLRQDILKLHEDIRKHFSKTATSLKTMIASADKPSIVINNLLERPEGTSMFYDLLEKHGVNDKNTLQYSLEVFVLTSPEYNSMFSEIAKKNSKLRLQGHEELYS